MLRGSGRLYPLPPLLQYTRGWMLVKVKIKGVCGLPLRRTSSASVYFSTASCSLPNLKAELPSSFSRSTSLTRFRSFTAGSHEGSNRRAFCAWVFACSSLPQRKRTRPRSTRISGELVLMRRASLYVTYDQEHRTRKVIDKWGNEPRRHISRLPISSRQFQLDPPYSPFLGDLPTLSFNRLQTLVQCQPRKTPLLLPSRVLEVFDMSFEDFDFFAELGGLGIGGVDGEDVFDC